MAALGSGTLDTGILRTHTLTVDVELRQMVGAGAVLIDGSGSAEARIVVEAAAGATDLLCTGLGPGVTSYDNLELALYVNGVRTLLDTGTGSCTPGWFPAVTITKVIGNLRLGVAYSGANVLGYSWWTDSATTIAIDVEGTVVRNDTLTEPPLVIGAGEIMTMGGATFNPPTLTYARFSNFTSNGVALTHGPYEIINSDQKYFGPTWRYTVDLALIGPDGVAVTGADATYNGARSVPSSFTQTADMFAEDGADLPFVRAVGAATLANPWLAAQTIRPYEADRTFVFEGNDPKDPTKSAVTTWNVGTVRINSPLTMLLSPNVWVASSGDIIVSGAGGSTWTVGATGSHVTRTLAESWRDWNTPAHPDEETDDNYTTTKHNYYASGATDDVWGWSLYAYLDVNLTVPSASVLTLRVSWAVILEDESIVTVNRSYTKTWTVSGTQRIDLLYPDEGEKPFYGERVDSIRISGFNIGAYTLNSMELVADQDAYLKHGFRSFTDTGGVMLAQDGEFVFSQWNGDSIIDGTDADLDGLIDRTKDHQNGVFDYAPDESDPVDTQSLGGAAGLALVPGVTLQQMFTELHRLEGLTATYDDTAFAPDAGDALTDSFGNTITARRAEWLRLNLPHTRVAKNTNVSLVARLVAADVHLVGGLLPAEQVIFQRNRLGMALEAQTRTAANARGGAGQTVTARAFFGGAPVGNDPSLGSGTTDASGFVTVPIRTGEYLDGSTYREFSCLLEGS
jgi:hypothetical protein